MEQLLQGVAGGDLVAGAGGPGQQLADAEFLAVERPGIRLQHPVRAGQALQQLGAAAELGAGPAAQGGVGRQLAALAQLLQPGQVQGRGEPVRGPGRQVVGLVHQHDAPGGILGAAEQTAQGGLGRKGVVVVADHHIRGRGRVQGQLERAQAMLVGQLADHLGRGAAQPGQGVQGARVPQPVVVAQGPGADLGPAVHLGLGADPLLGPERYRAHGMAFNAHSPDPLDAVLGHPVLAVAWGGVEHLQILVQGPGQGREHDGGGLAQPGGRLDQQAPAVPQRLADPVHQLLLAGARRVKREGQGGAQAPALQGARPGPQAGLVLGPHPGRHPVREPGVGRQLHQGLGQVQQGDDADPAAVGLAGVPLAHPGIHAGLQGEGVFRILRQGPEDGRRAEAGLDLLHHRAIAVGQQQIDAPADPAGEARAVQLRLHRQFALGVRFGPELALLDPGVHLGAQGPGVLIGDDGQPGIQATRALQGRHEGPHRQAQGAGGPGGVRGRGGRLRG